MKHNDINFDKLTFKRKPIPIPIDYRPTYKIIIIILVLKICCNSETSSLLKLHLFSWALKSKKNMSQLKKYVESNYENEFEVWNIEPALNRALQYAVADKLCELTSTSKYKLTDKGNRFYNTIIDSDVFEEELIFLKFLGKRKITDKILDEMTKQWKIDYE